MYSLSHTHHMYLPFTSSPLQYKVRPGEKYFHTCPCGSLWVLFMMSALQLTLEQRFELLRSPSTWTFFNKYLYFFDPRLGVHRHRGASCMCWSVPFTLGTWASMDTGTSGDQEPIPCRDQGATSVLGESKVILAFSAADVQTLTVC